MNEHRGLISFRTAILLYCALLAAACYALKGNIRIVIVLLIVLLIGKSYVHYLRERSDL